MEQASRLMCAPDCSMPQRQRHARLQVVTWGWNGGGQLGWEPSKTMDAWAARPVTFQGHSADDGWIPSATLITSIAPSVLTALLTR